MFKIQVMASSFEELKENLTPLFKMMDAQTETGSTKETFSAKDHGYTETEDTGEEASPATQFGTTFTHYPNTPVEVPAIAPATEATSNSSPDRDARGVPWDNRIHSANKGMNKDGSWKKRRNVDEAVVKEIEAGLTAPVVPVAIPAVPNFPPSVGTAPAIVPGFPPVAPVTTPAIPEVPQVPEAPSPVAVNAAVRPAHNLETFRANFIMIVNNLLGSKALDANWLQQMVTLYGIQNWWDVVKYDDKIKEVFQAFVGAGFVTNVG